MRHWGIAARVLFVAVVPAVLIAVALAWFFTYARIGDLDQELRERGYALARLLAPASEYGVFSGNREVLRQLTDSAVLETGVTYVAIMDSSREILASSGNSRRTLPAEMVLTSAPMLVSEVEDGLLFVVPVGRTRFAGDEFLSSELSPVAPGRPRVIGAVLIELSRAPMEAHKRELIITAALITLGGLLVAALLAQRLSLGVSRPVLQLARTVGHIKSGDLSARASIEAGGSLKLLEAGINDMASSLRDAQANLEMRIALATAELQRQKELAERANRTKTQFLAAASHDLRQPIQAVGLFVSALRLRSKDPDTLQYVASIERSLGGLETVLDGLLDISRLDAGVVAPRFEAFPVARILDSLRVTFSSRAVEFGLKLRIARTAAWCRSDPQLLERILSNLVSNAIRYTPNGGVCVGCRRRGERLRIEVWDTGIGIPENKREEVFREFTQLGNPQRRRDKGLGLGLAIVDRLSKLLDHPLTLRSSPGLGTVFTIEVPRTEPVLAGPPPDPQHLGSDVLAGRRVLVVDDDRDVLDALEAFLLQLGALVLVAESEEEARSVIADSGETPNVILCDFRLAADRDGIKAVEDLRVWLGMPVPAIIITGEASECALQKIADAGLIMLHKPVRPRELVALLVKLFDDEAREGGK